MSPTSPTSPTTATPAALPAALQRQAHRALQLERGAIDEAARTVTLAFASEAPVERSFGLEVLAVQPSAMRMGRLQAGANLLMDHDTRDVVGVVENVEISAGVARAVVRFGKSARAEEVFRDVLDGIRRNVSVGYLIHTAEQTGKRDGLDVYRVTDWEPFEVSLVSVPADASVGVGRAAELPAEQPAESTPETLEAQRAEPELEPAPATQPTQEIQMTTHVIEAPAQRDHAKEITAIAASIPGGADLAMSAIQRGLTVEQFQREALDKLSSKPLPSPDVGLSSKEVRSFDVSNVIRALFENKELQGLEREASDEARRKMGKSSGAGYVLPSEVMRRDLVKSPATAGGNLVATDLLGGSFIERLREAVKLEELGVQMMTDLQGNVAVPKQTGESSVAWVAENTATTESQPSFGQVVMSPKTITGWVDIGRTLMNQASVNVEQVVMNDLLAKLGRGVQLAVINGSGANSPQGLLTIITPTVVGGTNGAAPTWQNIIDLETAVSVGNADVGSLAYFTNPKVRGKLKLTQKFASTNGMPVYESGDAPLNGYRAAISNAVPSNLTKGTGTNLSAIIYGNWADAMIGMWGGLELMRDPYSGSTAGTVRIVAIQDVDFAVRNTESFATMVDAITV